MTSPGRGETRPGLAEARRRCRASMHPASVFGRCQSAAAASPSGGDPRGGGVCAALGAPANLSGPEPPAEPTYVRGVAAVVSKTGARGRGCPESCTSSMQYPRLAEAAPGRPPAAGVPRVCPRTWARPQTRTRTRRRPPTPAPGLRSPAHRLFLRSSISSRSPLPRRSPDAMLSDG